MELMMSEHVPGACPSGTVAFVPSASSPDGLDPRLQSTGGAYTPGPWAVSTGCDQFVCSDSVWIASTMGVKGETGAANARLIAAAPELLEALKAVERYCDARGLHAIRGMARAGIAKAEGR